MRKKSIDNLTVCICTFNRWESLKQTLESVLNQTAGIPYILIIDDHSDEKISKELKYLISKSEKIKLIRHKSNYGLAKARNTAIRNTKTEYFTFLDDDDKWIHNYLEKAFLEINLNRNSQIFLSYRNTKYKFLEKKYKGTLKLEYLFLNGFCPPVGMQIYNTELLLKIGGYNESVKSGIDLDLWIKLLKINPSLTCLWGNFIEVGKYEKNRITTNQKKRIDGTKKSLEIWKDYLIKYKNENFYEKFYREYINHIYAGFITQNLKNLAFNKLFKGKINFYIIKKIISNFIKHRLLGYNGNPTLNL